MLKKINSVALIIATILLAASSLTSCRTHRGAAVSPTIPAASESPAVGIPDVNTAFDALVNSYSNWQDVSMPVKVQLNSPSKLSVSGNLKMIRDKALYISLRVFGIEVASVYADNDTILVYAKVNDKYFAESLAKAKARYGFSLSDIQSLLLGQAFTPGEGALLHSTRSRYKVEAIAETIPGNDYVFSFEPADLPEWLHWHFLAGGTGDSTPSLIALQVEPDGMKAIDCIFGQAVESPAGIISSSLRLGTSFKGKEIDAQIILSPDRAKWNDGIKLSAPRIAPDATRISDAQILKMIGSGK